VAGVPLALELEPALPAIEGDATQLRQVIHNLIANAQEAFAFARAVHMPARQDRRAHGTRVAGGR